MKLEFICRLESIRRFGVNIDCCFIFTFNLHVSSTVLYCRKTASAEITQYMTTVNKKHLVHLFWRGTLVSRKIGFQRQACRYLHRIQSQRWFTRHHYDASLQLYHHASKQRYDKASTTKLIIRFTFAPTGTKKEQPSIYNTRLISITKQTFQFQHANTLRSATVYHVRRGW